MKTNIVTQELIARNSYVTSGRLGSLQLYQRGQLKRQSTRCTFVLPCSNARAQFGICTHLPPPPAAVPPTPGAGLGAAGVLDGDGNPFAFGALPASSLSFFLIPLSLECFLVFFGSFVPFPPRFPPSFLLSCASVLSAISRADMALPPSGLAPERAFIPSF